MSEDDPELRGIGGWLALFIIILAFIWPMRKLTALASLLADAELAAAYGPGWPALAAVMSMLCVTGIAASWFFAWRLKSRRNWQSIRIVAAGLWISTFGIYLVELISVSLIGGVPFHLLVTGTAPDLIGSAIFCTIWSAYLLASVRVANTYDRYGDGQVGEVFA